MGLAQGVKPVGRIGRPNRWAIPALVLSLGLFGLSGSSQARGPQSVADVADKLINAVVNISTSQTVKGSQGAPMPRVPQGSPFEDLFEDFFENKQGNQPRTDRKVSSLGSGFVIDAEQGLIVTNTHVIEGADEIIINFSDGSKLKVDKVVGKDGKTDLALLKVTPKKPLTAVKFGPSEQIRVGDWVMAIGNPFGLGGSVTVGIISAKARDINSGPYDDYLQTDAAINKGNSGGPLFDMHGDVIGINTAIISPSGGSIGIGFAVPTELAENIVHQLIEFGETRRGWLGVRIQPVTDEVAESLGLDRARGALVSGVVSDGPIKNGEIKSGDVILTFDGQPVNQMRDLPRVVAESPVGKEVDVVVLREGTQQTVKVTLGQLEDSAEAEDGAQQPAPSEDQGQDSSPENTPDNPDADTNAASATTFGMSVATLDEEQRKTFDIAEGVEGVVVTAVEPNSPAAQKGIKAGDVVVEVAQDFVERPADLAERIDALKAEGRRNAHLMIADRAGNLRFIALPLE